MLRLFVLQLCLCLGVAARSSPVVQKLESVVDGNPQLALSLSYNLANAPKEWTFGSNLTCLYDFFDLWLNALVEPDPSMKMSSPTSYITPMWALATKTDNSVFFRDTQLVDWLTEFILARGVFMDSAPSWNSDLEQKWAAVVNMSDYVIPEGGFTSFNSFFTRQIKPGLRPVDPNPSSVVAPSDGYIWVQDTNVQPQSNYQLKSDNLGLQSLLGYHPLYKQFVGLSGGGTAIINYLDSPNYHHVWSPVNGKILAFSQLGGLYVAGGDPCCVSDHRRAYIIFDTQAFGVVAMVLVGMYDISSIVFESCVAVNASVTKGQELAHFAYGGSEIITFFEHGRLTPDPDISKMTTRNVGQRYGTSAR